MQTGEEKDESQYQDSLFIVITGGTVIYSSKMQGSVALSSTESEYMTLLHTLKELIWLHRPQWNRLRVIYCGNQGVIVLAYNPEHHARTKHIDIQYHIIRNCVEDGTV
jgi:hypothetical protein